MKPSTDRPTVVRRPELRTGIAALLALLFFGGLGVEAYGLHACPRHHGPAPGSAASSHSGEAAPRAVVSAPADEHGDDGGDLQTCTCIGSCHGGAAAPMPGIAPPLALPIAGTSVAVSIRGEGRSARDRPAYFLPFANGPPQH